MVPSIINRSILASLLFLVGSTTAQTSAAAAPGAIQTLGCYSNSGHLSSEGSWTYQTSGYCQTQCAGLNKPVMATTQGSTCFCGDSIPADNYKSDNSSCDSPCDGYDKDMCGGLGFWTVYLTGLNALVETDPSSSSATSTTSGSTTSKTSSPAVVTKPGETVVVTASSTPSPASSSGGSSKVGVAVGVVVGLIGVVSIVGGVILFLKNRRRKAIEEEHRRTAAVTSFVNGKPERSMTDQRLDVGQTNKFRRQSIGSIADENDFSRRILQVRNPDSNRSSTMSGMGV